TTEQGGVSINYSLSPRTQIGTQANSSQVDSSLGRYILTNTGMFVSHKLTPNWFVRVFGGPSLDTVLRIDPRFSGRLRQAPGLGYSAQGNLGYTVRDHSLIGSYSRTISDTYGFGSQSSQTLAGSWQWTRPGRSWSLYAS